LLRNLGTRVQGDKRTSPLLAKQTRQSFQIEILYSLRALRILRVLCASGFKVLKNALTRLTTKMIFFSDLIRLSVPSFVLRTKAFHYYPGYGDGDTSNDC